MQETWLQSLVQEEPLEKGRETHSSILAWRIPWIEDPGRLQSKGLQRVRHNRATKHSIQHTALESNKKPSAFSSVLSLPVLVCIGNQIPAGCKRYCSLNLTTHERTNRCWWVICSEKFYLAFVIASANILCSGSCPYRFHCLQEPVLQMCYKLINSNFESFMFDISLGSTVTFFFLSFFFLWPVMVKVSIFLSV